MVSPKPHLFSVSPRKKPRRFLRRGFSHLLLSCSVPGAFYAGCQNAAMFEPVPREKIPRIILELSKPWGRLNLRTVLCSTDTNPFLFCLPIPGCWLLDTPAQHVNGGRHTSFAAGPQHSARLCPFVPPFHTHACMHTKLTYGHAHTYIHARAHKHLEGSMGALPSNPVKLQQYSAFRVAMRCLNCQCAVSAYVLFSFEKVMMTPNSL